MHLLISKTDKNFNECTKRLSCCQVLENTMARLIIDTEAINSLKYLIFSLGSRGTVPGNPLVPRQQRNFWRRRTVHNQMPGRSMQTTNYQRKRNG